MCLKRKKCIDRQVRKRETETEGEGGEGRKEGREGKSTCLVIFFLFHVHIESNFIHVKIKVNDQNPGTIFKIRICLQYHKYLEISAESISQKFLKLNYFHIKVDNNGNRYFQDQQFRNESLLKNCLPFLLVTFSSICLDLNCITQ